MEGVQREQGHRGWKGKDDMHGFVRAPREAQVPPRCRAKGRRLSNNFAKEELRRAVGAGQEEEEISVFR